MQAGKLTLLEAAIFKTKWRPPVRLQKPKSELVFCVLRRIMEDTELETPRERALELLNAASSAQDAVSQTRALGQLQEILLHRERALLHEFIDDYLAHQINPFVDVRKSIPAFIEKTL